jgi:hypothetical protein
MLKQIFDFIFSFLSVCEMENKERIEEIETNFHLYDFMFNVRIVSDRILLSKHFKFL